MNQRNTRSLSLQVLLLLTTLLGACQRAGAQTIWVEAERPLRAATDRHPSWYDKVKKDQLSGGGWISHWSDKRVGVVDYAVQVPAAARYNFWVRANPVETKLSYSLGGGKWTPIDMTTDVVDTVNVAIDEKPDLRFLGWKHVGEIPLSKGKQTISFRMSSADHHHGAIDAFVLTTETFFPDGKARPGKARSGGGGGRVGQAGTWPFSPQRDTFAEQALLDLRGLNEVVAGQSGFVRLSKDGEVFVLGDGKPVRFWALTTEVQNHRDREELAHHARFLAKRGVNMVRLHGSLPPVEKDREPTVVDQKTIDGAWKLVAAMKKEGIYTTISPYWAANVKKVPASWGIEGWPENMSPQGLLFFNPRLQQAYKGWLKALLSPPNPYTGIPLAKDPALAIIQIQNEDSMLFWTMQGVKGRQLELLGEQFGNWLTRKYGSLGDAFIAWKGDSMKEDDVSRGIVGIHIVWEWTQPREGGLKRRLDDQLHFFAETMYNFNREIARFLREELGCRQLVNAGNWRTADAIRLNDVERWTYTANELVAVNRYYSPVHIGPDRGWRIDKGDRFEDVSVLRTPRELPLNLKQVAGHPNMITETHWVPPMGYQSEAPFLAAAYQSLTGTGPIYWFNTGEPEWSNTDRAEWDSASRAKWSVSTPVMMAQFPAAALMYRAGYIKQASPVVVEHRSLSQLWERVPPLIAEDPGYDPNRDLGDAARPSNLEKGVDPLAFLVGPVKVIYDSEPSKTTVVNLARYIDHDRKVVQSATGQLAWDYGSGVCILDAPHAQGATGFLGSVTTIRLKDVSIDSANDYATVILVSLDGEPLKTSRRILVQVGTRARPTGWVDRETTFKSDDGKTEYTGKEVVDTGKMPWAVADARLTLTIANPAIEKATLLDINGMPRGRVDIAAEAELRKIAVPRDTLYLVLEGK